MFYTRCSNHRSMPYALCVDLCVHARSLVGFHGAAHAGCKEGRKGRKGTKEERREGGRDRGREGAREGGKDGKKG